MSRSPDPDPSALQADSRVVWTEDILRYGDTDANGHINNSAFAVFCESGRVNYLREALRPVEENGGFFVVAKLTIEFRAELFYPGRVRCGTWVSKLGRSSLTFSQVLVDDAGRLAGVAEAVAVVMDGPTRRPAPIAGELRAWVERMVRPGPDGSAA